jgi:hypothetical protein
LLEKRGKQERSREGVTGSSSSSLNFEENRGA